MKVNFNNLRKQAIYAYDSLTKKLNEAIIKENGQYALPNSFMHDHATDIKGYILIDAEEIQKDMDKLRNMIGSIAMVYEEGNKEFADVYVEVFPDENNRMKTFNDPDDAEEAK
jgi:hypothetical protein